MVAEILTVLETEGASAVDAAKPGNACALADADRIDAGTELRDASDDLMAGSDSVAQGLEFASGDMEIGAANAAGLDLEKHVAGTGFGDGQVFEDQRARNDGSGMVQDGGAHLAFYSRGFRSSNVVGMSSATVG
jgi:hypothetical protein